MPAAREARPSEDRQPRAGAWARAAAGASMSGTHTAAFAKDSANGSGTEAPIVGQPPREGQVRQEPAQAAMNERAPLEQDPTERVTASRLRIDLPIEAAIGTASVHTPRPSVAPELQPRSGPTAAAPSSSTPLRSAAAAGRTKPTTEERVTGTHDATKHGTAAAATDAASQDANATTATPTTAAGNQRTALATTTATPAAEKQSQNQNRSQDRGRRRLDDLVTHWLGFCNAAIAIFLAGAVAAPMLLAFKLTAAADTLYQAYHLTCHQWAFRSFFLGPGAHNRGLPIAIYSADDLAARGVDPFSTLGDASLGWKIAICERDLAIYLAVLLVGLVYARRRQIPTLHPFAFVTLALPMALDGFTQLIGWRESTWELRVLTGSLFGLGCAWFVLPTLDAMLTRRDDSDNEPCPSAPHA